MINRNLSYILLLVLAVMSSCSNDNDINSTKSEFVNSVRVTVEDFQPETATRTAYTVDGSGFHFQWTDGDALGIYPVGGDQVKFPISNGDGSASATFDGGAWKLRSEYQYAAYYPFSADNYTVSESALPASFTGQTQNGNGSTAHLGAYDYLACAATAPDANGGVDLTMKHLGAFLRLQLTMPKADTYSSVVLESDGAQFVTAGTFDLAAATPAITPTATSSTYTINLMNVATTEKNQVVTVYAIVAPANLSTSNIKVTVHGTGQTTYVQTVTGKNFAARSAYNIAVDNFPSGTNASGEDVGWDESETEQEEDVNIEIAQCAGYWTCISSTDKVAGNTYSNLIKGETLHIKRDGEFGSSSDQLGGGEMVKIGLNTFELINHSGDRYTIKVVLNGDEMLLSGRGSRLTAGNAEVVFEYLFEKTEGNNN